LLARRIVRGLLLTHLPRTALLARGRLREVALQLAVSAIENRHLELPAFVE
jgi:hypothetical protein